MFLRRRSRARQVHVSLPRGHQVDVTIPSPPWKRQARSRWTQPRAIGAAIAAAVAGLLYMVSTIAKRRSTVDHAPARPTATDAANGSGPAVTPAIQEPTSDREPDEIDRLARLDPTTRR
jgi:hypothetical protein